MEKNTITINKKIAMYEKEIEVSGDIIVPDIKPDIVNVIASNGNAYIYKEEISAEKVKVDGNLDSYIVYLADNGETRSIGTTLNFFDNFDDSKITLDSFSKSTVKIKAIESRALNERKISLKAILNICIEVYCKEEVQIGFDSNVLENVEYLKESVETKTLVGRSKVKTSVKEEIAIPEGYSASEILKVGIEVSKAENKISYNKVLAKSEANIKVLFLAEDGRIGLAEASVPVMSFIDLEGVKEEQKIKISYNIRNMVFKANSSSISSQIEFEVGMEAYETRNLEIVQDMYGIKNDIEFSEKNIVIPVNSNDKDDQISINERVLVEDILNIYDSEITFREVNRNNGIAECEVTIEFYYEADSRNGLNYKKVQIPFNVRTRENAKLKFQANRKKFTVSGEYVDCDLEILSKFENMNYKEIKLIDNVNVRNEENDEDYNMFIYFVKEKDTIWSIAKMFKVKVDELIALNSIENPNAIKVGDRIYVMR